MMRKFKFRGSSVVTICLMVSLVGLLSGYFITGSVQAVTKSRFKDLEIFNKVLYLIESQYYREVDVSKLMQGAIKGMLETLDPHSSYLSEEIFKKMQSDTSGEFGGLGIEVSIKDGIIYITTPLDDTPAFRVGLKSGDRIIEINHDSILGLTLGEAVKRMKGKPGSKINIGVSRKGVSGIKRFELKRESIKIKPVKYQIIKKNFAYIRLTQFQKNSAKYIRKAFKKIETKLRRKGGIKGVILDLRSNPGGLLDEAVEVSSIFLKDGVVVSTEQRDPKNKEIRYVSKIGKKYLDVPMVILVNGASASASEIVAGALQDHNRGIIMGTRSFGKGSVQSVVKIDEKNGLKLTIAQYMTPSNRKIQAIGIKPDIDLEEMDLAWMEKHQIESNYVREADLRNHLVATIATDEEKKLMAEQHKIDRARRVKLINNLGKKRKGSKDEEEEDIPRRTDPKTDYQVLQAIKYLKSFSIYEKMKK